MPETRYRRATRTLHRVGHDRVLVQRIETLGSLDSQARTAFDVTGVAALVYLALEDDSMTLEQTTARIASDVDVVASDVADALVHLTDVGLVERLLG